MKVKLTGLFVVGICVFLCTACSSIYIGNEDFSIIDEKTIKDNRGVLVTIEEPFTSIVSLYSAHTENLYTIGAGNQLIGASDTSIYPPEVAFLDKFDYKGDPEALINANPDLVIIRPFIQRSYPDYVKAIEKAGIQVVSLYPDSYDKFEEYITILSMLTGKEEEAKEQIILLNSRLNEIEEITANIPLEDRQKVYFESTKTAYRTVIPESNPGRAIEIAGGINIAKDVEPITKGSTIAEFGIENIMIHAAEIDVYISQRGAMNSGGSIISIPQREGFKAIKAVREGRILELNEKIISSPTFRYYKGVNEIARMLYPDVIDNIEFDESENPITREDYAKLLVKYGHIAIFVPSSSHYYEQDYRVHTYGMYTDVAYTYEKFDYIETAALNSLIKGYEDQEGNEFFNPLEVVTREDLAYTLYILSEEPKVINDYSISDIDSCSEKKIVEKIVSYGWMDLDEQNQFNPQQPVTQLDVLETLKVLNDNE